MTDLIKCPECNTNFPFNRSKHRNRNYRICPFCHARIPVDMPPFIPNAAWGIEKLTRTIRHYIGQRLSGRMLTPYAMRMLDANPRLSKIIFVRAENGMTPAIRLKNRGRRY